MSASLEYRIVKPTAGVQVSHATRMLMTKHMNDGVAHGTFIVDQKDAPFLRGAMAATSDKEVEKELYKILEHIVRGEKLEFTFSY